MASVLVHQEYDQLLGLFLAHHAPLDPLTRIEELDGFQGVSVMSGIVAFLAGSSDRERLPEARLLMDRLIGERGEAGKPARLEAASLLGFVIGHEPQDAEEVVRPAAHRRFDALIARLEDGKEVELTRVIGNHQRLRRHEFAPILARSIRLEVAATNGSEQARVYEVRCYG